MRFLWLSAAVVALDQATKAAVLQFMASPAGIPRSIPLVGDWLRLTFTENPGMAFGITLGPPGTVTVLSILATILVAGYIYQVRNEYAPYVWSLSLILGGALGNIIDRVFYGVLLDYGTYFTGHVVDFIHVSLWKGFIPDVVPYPGRDRMRKRPRSGRRTSGPTAPAKQRERRTFALCNDPPPYPLQPDVLARGRCGYALCGYMLSVGQARPAGKHIDVRARTRPRTGPPLFRPFVGRLPMDLCVHA